MKDSYEYKGYSIVYGIHNCNEVYAYKDGKMCFQAETEKGVEYQIDKELNR